MQRSLASSLRHAFLILLFMPAQESRAAIRESWGKLIRESYSSQVVMRFFVHEDCGTGGPCEEAEAGSGDVVYTHDGDDELGPLAEGQEGVTQRVCIPLLHIHDSVLVGAHSAQAA